MISRLSLPKSPLAALLAVGAVFLVVGCGGGDDELEVVQAPPPPPPRAAAPPPPPLTSVSDLMARLGIDERVYMAEDAAPKNDSDRIAVLEFFDAFVRADSQTLRSMLSATDAIELDRMVSSGEWDTVVTDVEEVVIETGPGPLNEKCALARFIVDGETQPQLWYYQAADESYSFDAVPTPPNVMDRLYGLDWITVWHQLLAEELVLANAIDQAVELEPVDLTGSGRSTPSAGGNPSGPSFGPGGGSGRRPTPPKRKPPGARR